MQFGRIEKVNRLSYLPVLFVILFVGLSWYSKEEGISEPVQTRKLYKVPEIESRGENVCVKIADAEPTFGYEAIPLSKEIQSQINDICEEYGISFEMMMAIAEQESRFDVSAFNADSEDYGLFQINADSWEKTAIELNLMNYKEDVFQNAEMACYIFNYCLERGDGDIRKALNYYRTGTQNNKYEAGSDYATIVLENYKNIKESE